MGLKLTPQRRIILDIIHDCKNHLSGEEIFERARARIAGVNKSTIYRTLELLEKLGCVYKSKIADRFIYHHAEQGHHHHIICERCDKTLDCDENLFLPVEEVLRHKFSFQVDFKHVVLRGLCQDCQSKNKRKN